MIYEDYFQPGLILQTERVILRNMQAGDIEDLWAITGNPELWTWFNKLLDVREDLEAWMEEAFQQQAQKSRFPFVVIDKLTGAVAGSTSLMSLSIPDRRIEIGSTWYGAASRGTGINTHCKFLLLDYVFGTMKFERVELKTDALNARSRAAISKLGMVQEGIFRSHMQMPNNRRRDSVYYSMLPSEWPAARERLLGLLVNR